MEKALFDWPIVLQYDVKAISRKFFGHEVFSAERSLNQPKARCVCIRSINQSNRSISVLLLFLFCSRVFISRSYENRSNVGLWTFLHVSAHMITVGDFQSDWRKCNPIKKRKGQRGRLKAPLRARGWVPPSAVLKTSGTVSPNTELPAGE